MPKNILWLDNDVKLIDPYVDGMRQEGYDVTAVNNVSEAEALINEKKYDLLILDVMIPLFPKEESDYNPGETSMGANTGLVFYKRNKDKLGKKETVVLVMTVRLDSEIQDAFTKEGMPTDCFETKHTLRELPVFLEKIKGLLG